MKGLTSVLWRLVAMRRAHVGHARAQQRGDRVKRRSPLWVGPTIGFALVAVSFAGAPPQLLTGFGAASVDAFAPPRLNCWIAEFLDLEFADPLGDPNSTIVAEDVGRRYTCVNAATADTRAPIVDQTASEPPVPRGVRGYCDAHTLLTADGFPFVELACTWDGEDPLTLALAAQDAQWQCESEGQLIGFRTVSAIACYPNLVNFIRRP